MLADCDQCELRYIGCADCVITVLPGGQAGIGPDERRALRVLAEAGMVPPLRFSGAPAPGRRQNPQGRRRNQQGRRQSPQGRRQSLRGPSLGEPVETAFAVH
jgi:hypothetical protein